jgi:predicted transcriptional regulator
MAFKPCAWNRSTRRTRERRVRLFLRLLRREVEALVKKTHGAAFLRDQQGKTELARINRELKRLATQIAALEERKSKLMAGFTR